MNKVAVVPASPTHLIPAEVTRLAQVLQGESPIAEDLRLHVRSWKGKQGPGFGKHGRVDQVTEQVDPAKIWVNADLYVWGEEDETVIDQSPEDWNTMLQGSERDVVLNDAGMMVHNNWDPILCIARKNEYDQPLMLWRGYRQLRTAQQNNWRFLKVLVYPDMPDYTIRDIALRQSLHQSTPTKIEVFRQLYCMEKDYAEGRRAEDSPPPPSQAQIGEALACTQAYVSQLSTVWNNLTARELVATKRLPVATALQTIRYLKPHPQFIEPALRYIADHELTEKPAHSWLEQYVKEQLPAPPKPKSSISYTRAYLREVRKALAILETHQDEIVEEIDSAIYTEGVSQTKALLQLFDDALAEF